MSDRAGSDAPTARVLTRRRALGLAAGTGGWLLGAAALGGCHVALPFSGAAGVPEPPALGRPETLDLIANPGDNDALITLQTLQGVLAQTRPRLYLQMGGGYGRWLEAVRAAGVKVQPAPGDVWTLLRTHAHELGGVVLYSPYEPDGINLATTLAGPLRAVAVSAPQRSLAEAAGLRVLADTSGKSALWAFQNYWPKLRHDVLIEQDPGKAALRDYGPAVRALTYYSGNDAGRAEVLAALAPGSTVLGWGDASHGENAFVGADSAAGSYNVASDLAYNLTALAGVRLPLRQPRPQGQPVPRPAPANTPSRSS